MHTMVSAVQFFGQFATWPEHVEYVGMPGRASDAFGIPRELGQFGKPWECVNHPEAFGATDWPEAFKNYLVSKLAHDEAFAEAVTQLHGKTLLCWCAAKDAPRCHAVILSEFAELLYHMGD